MYLIFLKQIQRKRRRVTSFSLSEGKKIKTILFPPKDKEFNDLNYGMSYILGKPSNIRGYP